jgi:hypothetical protein
LTELAKGGGRDDGPDPIEELVRQLSAPLPAEVGDTEEG